MWARSLTGLGGHSTEYEFWARSTRYHVVSMGGASLKTMHVTLEPVGVLDEHKAAGTIRPTLNSMTLEKLKTRIAFAKKRDDGLYEQDGSSRGAEVVWKAINAYIAREK